MFRRRGHLCSSKQVCLKTYRWRGRRVGYKVGRLGREGRNQGKAPHLYFSQSPSHKCVSECACVRARVCLCVRASECAPPSGQTRPQCAAEKAALSCGRVRLRRPPGGEDALKSSLAEIPGVQEEPPLQPMDCRRHCRCHFHLYLGLLIGTPGEK